MSEDGFIRLAPPSPAVSFTDDQAIEAAKAAFHDARRSFAAAQTKFGYLTSRLFDPGKVDYRRLKSLRSQTRDAIQEVLATEADLSRAIEAMEAPRPMDGPR